MTVELVNLTPHQITLIRPDGSKIVLPKSNDPARVRMTTEVVGEVQGIPLKRTVYGEVMSLPAPRDGVVYVVSTLVLKRIDMRQDLVAPMDVFRDDDGKPLGAQSLNVG